MSLKQYAIEILHRFPLQHIKYAFCYGSGVYQQKGSDMTKNMIDFILVANDSSNFHKQNLKSNLHDYSFVRHLGVSPITSIQGHGVYFNTMVPYHGRLIKYGVVNGTDFKSDLLDWTSLYVSGRLHKPVLELYTDEDKSIHAALYNNLQSAVHCALLLLPDTFTEQDLYTTIAGLSYSDVTYTVAPVQYQQKDFKLMLKISMTVIPRVLEHVKWRLEVLFYNTLLRALYKDILENEEMLLWDKKSGIMEQLPNYQTRFHHLNNLPGQVLENLVDYCNKDRRSRDTEEVIRLVANNNASSNCSELLRRCICDIVKVSSYQQTMKSAVSAGVIKSVRYAYTKLLKMIKSQMYNRKSHRS